LLRFLEHRCDLLTGEDRKFAIDSSTPSNHLSCTVEMLRVDKKVEVVVIDEIQMLRDDNRGWAWTRALLGAAADEIHLCGEKSAVPIVKRLLSTVGEDVIVQEYERKSKLVLSTHSLRDVGNVQVDY
jgi:ATP-dependent RNA helicase SUPV3L1/SUV3